MSAQDRFVGALTQAASRLMGANRVPAELLSRVAASARNDLDEDAMDIVASLVEEMVGEPSGKASCLPYPGGKCKIGAQIVEMMPKHKHYVEVFGGSGACLLLKPRSEGVEVYNDVSPYLVSLMKVLGDPVKAKRLQRRLLDMLESRDLATRLFVKHRDWRREAKDPRKLEKDEVERALVLLIGLILHMTPVDAEEFFFNGPGLNQRVMRASTLKNKAVKLHHLSARMAGVQVYNLDWRKLIAVVDKQATYEKWNPKDVLFYIDPPYVEESIHDGFNGYYGAAGKAFDLREHDDLVSWILKTPAKVMLSGKAHDSEPLNRLERSRKITRHDIKAKTRGQGALVESVWCNF